MTQHQLDELPQLLMCIRSTDNAARNAAEHRIQQLSALPGFFPALVVLCCGSGDGGADGVVAMLAMSTLKRTISAASTPPEALAAIGKGLLDGLLFRDDDSVEYAAGLAASVVTTAIALLERQAGMLDDDSDDDDGRACAESSTPARCLAASQARSALLTYLFTSLSQALTAVAADGLAAAQGSQLPARAVAVLQELSDSLPLNSPTRDQYLLGAVPTLLALVCGGGSTITDVLSAAPTAEAAAGLRLRVAAARLLEGICALRSIGAGMHGLGGGAQSAAHSLLADSLTNALAAGGLAKRIAAVRLAPVAQYAQGLQCSSSSSSSLQMTVILLALRLECLVLSFCGLASRIGAIGKYLFAPRLLHVVHQALRDDAGTYLAAIGAQTAADDDDDNDIDDYDDDDDGAVQSHSDASCLIAARIRKYTLARWSYLLNAATGGNVKRAGLLRGLHSDEGLANGQAAHAEVEAHFALFTAYAHVSPAAAARWARDPAAFLRSEDDSGQGWAVRDVVCQVMRRYCRVLKDYFTQIALESLFGTLVGPSGGEWQEREAALFLMAHLLSSCRAEVLACGAADYSLIAEALLARDVGSANPAVAARALDLLGKLISFLARAGWSNTGDGGESITSRAVAQRLCVTVLPSAVTSLAAEGTPPLIRVCACLLLREVLPSVPANALLEGFAAYGSGNTTCPSAQQALLQLLTTSSIDGEVLYLVFEVLTRWLTRLRRLQEQDVATGPGAGTAVGAAQLPLEPSAHRFLLAAWRARLQDPNMAELVLAAFNEYVRCPACDDGLTAELPWLQHLLNERSSGGGNGSGGGGLSASELCSVPSVVLLVAHVFHRGSERAAAATAQAMLDPLCLVLLSTDESAILEAASSCLAALLLRCPQAESVGVRLPPSLLYSGTAGGGGSAHTASRPSVAARFPGFDEERVVAPLTTVLVATVLRMLSADRSEASLLNVGAVLVAIVEKAPQFSEEQLHTLIDTVARRLESSRTATVAQQLIAPLAVLLAHYRGPFLAVLREAGMLQRTFEGWLPRVSEFLGAADILRSCAALVALLGEWPQSGLEGVSVRWDTAAGASGAVDQKPRGKKAKGKKDKAVDLPLDVAVFLAVGRSVVVLAGMLESGEWWEEVAAEAEARDGPGGRQRGMWHEDSDGDEFEDCNDEDGEEEEELEVGGTGEDRMLSARRQLLPVFVPMQPLLERYGAAVTPFFTVDELAEVQAFFALLLSP